MIRNLFTDRLGHQRIDPERRALFEQVCRFNFYAFEEITQKGFNILHILYTNDCAPTRIDEKSQTAIRILKQN